MNTVEYVARVKSHQTNGAVGEPCDVPEAELVTRARIPEPADDTPARPEELQTLGLIELLLKDRRRLHRILRQEEVFTTILPRLLGIALTGFALFGVTMSLVLTVSGRWPALVAIESWLESPLSPPITFEEFTSPIGKLAPWISRQAYVLTGAFAFGLVAASGVALPSLYFYCLLAGIRMSMVEIVVHAVKAKAIASVALVGILPIYLAIAMGVVIFDFTEFYLPFTLFLGLILPFVAGAWGTASLYHGFAQLCDTMPADRAARRECFLRRLVLSWSACYSAIMPVMIYSLWEVLSR
jgi:hypothetical protein